jgi:hypothetical protein
MTWQRSIARTGYRRIADSAGRTVADCVSYSDGPSLEESEPNAELIVSGEDCGRATPAPWLAVPAVAPIAWLVRGGPHQMIVALVPDRPDAREIAERIALSATEDRRPAPTSPR